MGACFKARIAAMALILARGAPLLHGQVPPDLYGRDARGANAVVAAARQEAAQAGIDMMRQGGNIVDAAIAASCVIGELLPS